MYFKVECTYAMLLGVIVISYTTNIPCNMFLKETDMISNIDPSHDIIMMSNIQVIIIRFMICQT
jgi:hypothetical protein